MRARLPERTILLLLGSVVYATLFVLCFYFNFRAPRLPASFELKGQNWVVSEGTFPLRTGDQLRRLGDQGVGLYTLLVDNALITNRAQFFDWLGTREEVYRRLLVREVDMTLERDGEEVEVSVPVLIDQWSFLHNSALIHLLVSSLFFIVGWATYRLPGAGREALWFYLLCFSMSLVYVTNITSLLSQVGLEPHFFRFVNILNVANFMLAPALLFHFSLLIPRARASWWILAAIYLPAAYALFTFRIALISVLVPCYFLGSLLAIGQGAWSYRGLVERQQMKWVGVGYLLGIGPWIAINGLPLLLTGRRLMSDTFPGACLVFIPIFMAVAIQKYRLFDVGSFLQGTLVYLATVGLLLGADFTLLATLDPGERSAEAYLVTTMVLLALYGPLRTRLAAMLDRLAHRSRLGEAEAVELLETQLRLAGPDEILQGLRITVHSLFAPEQFEEVSPAGRAVGAYLELDDPPKALLVLSPEVALRCGPLPRGRFFNSRDMKLLDHLARHCSLHHQTQRLYREAAQERQRRLSEKERLLGDLHDGVGSALAGIRLLSKEPQVSRLADDALFELRNFLYDGPDFTMTREAFMADIRSYGQNLFEDKPLHFEVQHSGDLRTTLSRSFALSIFRFLKEIFTNALRHSNGKSLSVHLDFGPADAEVLRIRVADDGTEFQASSSGRGLSGMKSRVEQGGGKFELETDGEFYLALDIPYGLG